MEQYATLRQLTERVFEGLHDKAIAQRLKKGLVAAKSGNHQDVLKAILDENQGDDNNQQPPKVSGTKIAL